MSRSYRELDHMDAIAGADRLPSGTDALRNYQRSLGVPVPEDHPERSADGPGGRRRKGRLSAQLGR
jgi:hypothetical protein